MEIKGIVCHLVHKATGLKSNMVSIDNLIYNQDKLVFEFPDGNVLSFKDYLYTREDYKLKINIIGDSSCEKCKCEKD